MTITYSGRSRPSAEKIAHELAAMGVDVRLNRGNNGGINWGRANANTELNSDISSCTNKRIMRQLFKEHSVFMPELYSVAEIINNFQKQVGPQVYIGRPDRHTKGRGLWKVYDYASLDRALKGTRRKQAATHFMAYIPDAEEYRVHIFLGKSIRISKKAFDVDGYTTIKPDCTPDDRKAIREAAKQAVAAVELDFGAVDVLLKDGRPYVLEVNSAPGLGGSMPKLYADTFKKWYEEQI
jgi:glutathione synthase/RimK-type ligase-like ATP-grasp enzyme